MSRRDAHHGDAVKLYRNPKSGHCHRVELMLALLNVPYQTVDLDMANGAHKAPDYVKISPFGQVPAIEDNGISLSDSNAILVYLADRYGDLNNWAGRDPLERAEVQRWLSVAAGEIFQGPCSARLATLFGVPLDHQGAVEKAHALFAVMEARLEGREWLALERATLADIAAYSYIAHAPEGGVSLEPYPSIRSWLQNIEALPGFVAMARSPALA
ncbi:glutathione S-transferase family protein [Nitratireductor basaltis]|uniref:Glutathione S-transferase domain-containing protein n=1 Tax=Nitratireductor basaltis TaxID=472175 RepID=A0A084U8N0_9HYPH|nr:Glutathione S-transferase domain-containing protein [Nitratireductor basaltis]